MTDHDTLLVSGLKDPWKFLFVDMDVAMLAVLVSMLLMIVGLSAVMAAAGGGGFAYVLHVSRRGKPKGFARHFSYWYFPPVVTQLRSVPPVWAHRTVG